jgi:Zn finger protein HypA/HybF involved in hydrogenase expression
MTMSPKAAKKPVKEKFVKYICLSCSASGPRSDCYKVLKNETPGYEDACPNCGSIDVDVFNQFYDPNLEPIPDDREWSN